MQEHKAITKRQKDALLAIYKSIKDEGFPPSLSDLKENLGVTSNQTVLDLLDGLEKRHVIKREEGSARGIKIMPLGYEIIKKEPLVRMAGATAAGPAIEMIEQNEWKTLSSGFEKFDNVFIVKVSGNSMINAGIYDGDSVLIKKENEYKNNDIVLASFGDDVTLKTYVSNKSGTYLKPENQNYNNIQITEDTHFLGKMISNLGK